MFDSALFEYAHRCGFMDEDGEIVKEIFEKTHYEDGYIYLNPLWPEELCKRGGIDKNAFVVFQIELLYFKIAMDKAGADYNIGIKVLGENKEFISKLFTPVWGELEYNKDRTAKSNIKQLKRDYPMNPKCGLKNKDMNECNIRICCVCNEERIKILKEK